jgi:hypothetical protein
MVPNYPHLFVSHALGTNADASQADGLGGRVVDRLHQMFCGLHGHDTLLHFEQERMSLRCVSCGHETPGWELNEAPPTVKLQGDIRRHALAGQIIGARRIA